MTDFDLVSVRIRAFAEGNISVDDIPALRNIEPTRSSN
jgi:hypothetical protein